MDERLIFGLGVAAVSLFLRWRFPAVPKPLATAGVVLGLGLIVWSQFLSIEPIYPMVGIPGAALAVAGVDWLIGRKLARKQIASSPPLNEIAATPELEPDHDTSLGHAMVYLCLGTWSAPGEIERLYRDSLGQEDSYFEGKLKEVEQKAADNKITIWGRHSDDLDSPLVKVPPSHWAKHWVQPGTLTKRANTFVIPDQDGDQEAVRERFYDLRVNRDQFDAAFRSGASETR